MENLLKTVILCLFPFMLLNGQENDSSMVLIAGGEFIMGQDSDRPGDFSPAHPVKVNAFYMDKREVTNKQYFTFCQETGYKLPEFWNTEPFRCGEGYPDNPVVGISWFDAMKYAGWAGKRLPTEAEWEYAARGGLVDKEFPNGNSPDGDRVTNEPGSWINLTHPVGTFPENGFGLFDMSGNAWEWVADSYDEDYYKKSPVENPAGPEKSMFRVIRGGSWHSGNMCKKVYYRKGLSPGWVDFAVGFRCVKDAE